MPPLELSRFLIGQTSLRNRLDEYEKSCVPEITLDSVPYKFVGRLAKVGDDEAERVTLCVGDGSDESSYVFGRWARSQLLTRMGAKEKWFSYVTVAEAAEELSKRKKALSGQRAKARMLPAADVGIVRGLVGPTYMDLPDTAVMDAVTEATRGGYMLLRGHSAKSETSMYCYLINPIPITVDGTDATVLGGALIRNSEVGYTSLWCLPFHVWIYDLPEYGGRATNRSLRVVVDEHSHLRSRRTHRGSLDGSELRDWLTNGLEQTPLIKGSNAHQRLSTVLGSLSRRKYSSEDEACHVALSSMRNSTEATKKRFLSMYRAAKHRKHTGLSLYETVLAVYSEEVGADASYKAAAMAGLLLYELPS